MSDVSMELNVPRDLKPSSLVGEAATTEGLGLDPGLRIVRAYTLPYTVDRLPGRKRVRAWAEAKR